MKKKGAGAVAPGAWRVFEPFLPQMHAAVSKLKPVKLKPVIESLGLEAACFIAMRVAVNMLLRDGEATQAKVIAAISGAIHTEAKAFHFWGTNPGRMKILTARATEENIRGEKYNLTLNRAARRLGVALRRWDAETQHLMGLLMFRAMCGVGVLVTEVGYTFLGQRRVDCRLNARVVNAIEANQVSIADHVPLLGPMVCEPDKWGWRMHGGFLSGAHKDRFQIITGQSSGADALDDMMVPKFRALNALQRTRLRVDREVLAVAVQLAALRGPAFMAGEPVGPPPPFPAALEGTARSSRTEAEAEEVMRWAARMKEYNRRKRAAVHSSARVARCITEATELVNEPCLWQAWHCDLTGRFYPGSPGISTMGSDFQKALLKFAHGHPITEEAKPYYLRNVAKLWGEDKGTNDELALWTLRHEPMILTIAADPVNNLRWMEAEKPWQFLRACLDYAGWKREGDRWLSHIPVAMDGSCNGLQHIACMAGDADLARAVNLTNSPVRHDIYQEAADLLPGMIESDTRRDFPFARAIAKHKPGRKVTKFPVMTMVYGARYRTTEAHLLGMIRDGEIEGAELGKAARASREIAWYVWQAAKRVTRATRPIMAKMNLAGRDMYISADRPDTMTYLTMPSGFVFRQTARQAKRRKAFSNTLGYYWWPDPTVSQKSAYRTQRQTRAFAANFIHACDAEHMTAVLNAASKAGIRDVWMNHDEFGCHAAMAPALDRIIRQELVALYRDHNPMQTLMDRAGHPFESGDFDLEQILQSCYSFR